MDSPVRVKFEKPNLNALLKENTVVDLHFHSHYSDGLNRIDKIAERALKLGIGVAITDHNEIRGAVELDRRRDVFSIPGIEVTAAEGAHLLVYFFNIRELGRFFEKVVLPHRGMGVMSSLSLPMAELVERTHDYQCLTIYAHPYCAMYTGICNPQFSDGELHNLLHMVDGVEAINANNLSKWNLKCSVLGFNLNRSMIAGSDGHSLSHMGRAVSYAPCPQTRSDFLEAIRHKANCVVGKEIALVRKVTSNGLKLRSNLNNYQDLWEKNFRYGCKVVHLKSQAIRSNVQRCINARMNAWPFQNNINL